MFFLDVGLLCCLSDVAPVSILIKRDDLDVYNGMGAEEYVARQLASAGLNLYYWSNDSTPTKIDFVIQHNGHATPVEVKSGTNVKGKSIARYVRDNPDIKGLRFSLLPYKRQDWLTDIPLYSIPFMSEFQLVNVGD